eukprot:SM000002S05682  [mRNA]  locus=s2:1511167:1515854:- [translate_table: standard]
MSMEGVTLDGSGLGGKWTYVEARPFSAAAEQALLPAEQIVAEVQHVVLVNCDITGSLLVTNFRLLFLCEGKAQPLSLGTIPICAIDRMCKLQSGRASSAGWSRPMERVPGLRLLQVIGKDVRTLLFAFRPRTRQRRLIHDALLQLMRPLRLLDLHAFAVGAAERASQSFVVVRDQLGDEVQPFQDTDFLGKADARSLDKPEQLDTVHIQGQDVVANLRAEYLRILDSCTVASTCSMTRNLSESEPHLIRDLLQSRVEGVTMQRQSVASLLPSKSGRSEGWRISKGNASYSICPTYPSLLLVPPGITDEDLLAASAFRARGRLPAVSWRHPVNGATLCRSAQPLVGIMLSSRNEADEKLVAALSDSGRKLYIADARPRKNALANGAMGGGSEPAANYRHSEVVFLGIENIHIMRESFQRLREYLDVHGACSSDGSSSLLRSQGTGGGWTGGNTSSTAVAAAALADSGWLQHVHALLAGAAWIAARIAVDETSVLVHCSDGWDRTAQLVSLSNLLLDPYYRTFRGFQALVEKDWLAFGHPFAERMGMSYCQPSSPSPSAFSLGSSSMLVDSLSSLSTSASTPVRGMPSASGNIGGGSGGGGPSVLNQGPIFLQWLDCVSQLLRIFPEAFEYTSTFLVDLADEERRQGAVWSQCSSMWQGLSRKRAGRGRDAQSPHPHVNVLYDPNVHRDVLLPPVAALAPLLWPQFYLRWALPVEFGAQPVLPYGPLSSTSDLLCQRMLSTEAAKRTMEERCRELEASASTLRERLERECLAHEATKVVSARAQQECASLQRGLQALGGHCQLPSGALSKVGEADKDERRLDMWKDADFPEEFAVSVSLTAEADRCRGASCRRASCRQGRACRHKVGSGGNSSLSGIRADFKAFDQLSIVDSYFGPDRSCRGSSSPPDRQLQQEEVSG